MSSSNTFVDGLVKEVNEAAKALPSDPFQDDDARKRLQTAAYRLTGALDAPIDGLRKFIFEVRCVWLQAYVDPTARRY